VTRAAKLSIVGRAPLVGALPMPYDDTIADAFLTAVKAGASNEVAAAHAQIPLQVALEWIRENDDFKARLDKARADLEIFAIGQVRQRVTDDKAAAMWFAERLHGDSELERLRELTT
jgi:hypothetical protein